MGSGASSLLGNRRGAIPLEKRIKYLRETPFFQYLAGEEMINEFARCFPRTIRSNPGKDVALDPRKIYIVCEGEVDLSTSYPQNGTKVEAKGYLCRKRGGDIVNVCSTKQDVERRMTAKSHKMKELAEDIMTVCSGDTGILLLCGDMDALDKFSKFHPELSKPIVEICTSQIEDRLLTIPFLKEVTKTKLGVLAAMCRYEAFDSEQTVFEEGSDADKLFLVLNGVAEVIAKSEHGQHPDAASTQLQKRSPALSEKSVALQRSLECSSVDRSTLLAETGTSHVTIAELKSGDYFGETALVFDVDRTCGVRTAGKCLFLTVHKRDFENFLKICPIEDSLKGVIKQRMVSKLSSLGIPFLDGIPEEMLASVGSSVEINEVPEDEVIFRQGDVGDRFYIIVYGSVKVDTVTTEKDAKKGSEHADDKCGDEGDRDCEESMGMENVLGSLGPGQYFGEMSLVNSDSHLRTATVTSAEKSILLSIDKDSFQTLFGHNNNILAEFEIRLLKKEAKLKHVLAHSLGVASFRDFLEAEHAGENIDYWVAVKDFKANTEDDSNKRKEKAKHIFVTFCADYADRQVNLPHNMIAEIDAKLQTDGDISSDLFDESLEEIFRLLEKDKFLRYKQGTFFKEFAIKIGFLEM